MVKKSYVMPVSNEARTRLRANLLAGSGPSFGPGTTTGPVNSSGEGTGGSNGDEVGGEVRRRSTSSID